MRSTPRQHWKTPFFRVSARFASSKDEGAVTSSTLEARIGSHSSRVFMTQSEFASSASVARSSGQRSVAEPITPGRFLREKVLEPERLTQNDLARGMSVSRLTVNEIINNRRTVTAEMALRLEAVTRVSALMWLNLQRNLDLHRAKVHLADVLPRLRPITRRREFVDMKTSPETDTDG